MLTVDNNTFLAAATEKNCSSMTSLIMMSLIMMSFHSKEKNACSSLSVETTQTGSAIDQTGFLKSIK